MRILIAFAALALAAAEASACSCMPQGNILEPGDVEEGMRAALAWTHNLSEASGTAPLAAAHKYRARLAGKKVVCVMSGGNADAATLRRVLAVAVD